MFYVDRVLAFAYPRPELVVVGWCCFENLTPADEMWVECDEVRAPCLTGLPRPDVARAYNTQALEATGFLCRFPTPRRVTPTKLMARHQGLEHLLGEFIAESQGPVGYPESEQHAYATWLRTHESRLHWPPLEVAQRIGSLSCRPVVSVILPTHNTPLYHLHRCIESVTTQLYPNWELCVTDDASADSRVRSYLLERAANEPRIRLSFSEHGGGISAASNRSIAASTGDCIVLLDHDDELHPSALMEVARCLNDHPETDVIYSDEDKIDQLGVRSWPAFKPEFDEDLLCGFNYFGHLVSMRSELVRQVGGFRSVSDGAQDWDLLLRVTSATAPNRIRHIPKPLYHWRMHENSTAFSLDAKPYATRAWKGVIESHLAAVRSSDVTEGLFRGSMRIARRSPNDTRVSIICRARDGSHQRRALNRSKASCQVTFFEMLLSAIRRADRDDTNALMTVGDLQSDVTIVVSCGLESVSHHFIEELTAQALRDDCGAVGATVLCADGTVLTAGLACLSDGTCLNPFEGLALDEPGYMGQARVVRSVPSIGPQVFAFRTSRLVDVNGLAALAEDSLSSVCAALVGSAHVAGLKVLHTPYAVATLRGPARTYCPRQDRMPPRHLMVNPNLENLSSVTAILKGGIR